MSSNTTETWSVRSLGDLLDLVKGASYSSDDLTGSGALIGLRAIQPGGGFRDDGTKPFSGKYRPDQELKAGDLVIALTDLTQDGAVLGSPALVPALPARPLVASLDIAVARPKPGLHRRFAYYMLSSPLIRRQIAAHATGTTVRRVKPADVLNSKVLLPQLDEQRRIAWVLGSLDDKIELNRKLARTLEEIAAALFEARFIDFIGVEEFEESEIGPVPKGWTVKPFSEVVEINPRVNLKKGQDAPYVEMAAVPAWGMRPSVVRRRPYKGGARFEFGDTLMARITGCIEHGKGAFADFIDEPASGSTEFLVFRATEVLSPEAVFFLSRTDRVREHAIANMSGSSGRQRVPTSCFRSLLIALPPSRESWSDLAKVLAASMHRTRAVWKENATLIALRNALLPKLISGEIRVPEGFGHSDAAEVAGELAREVGDADPSTAQIAAAAR